MHEWVDQMVGFMAKKAMDAHTENLQRGKDALANIQIMEKETGRKGGGELNDERLTTFWSSFAWCRGDGISNVSV